MSDIINFFVSGEPKPKGSMKGFPVKRRDGSTGIAMTNNNPKTKDWQLRISHEAQCAFEGRPLITGPVEVQLVFFMPRPKKPKNPWPIAKNRNDADKLARCGLDGLTGVIFEDDGQVVMLGVIKCYSDDKTPIGCQVMVREL